MSEVRTMSYIPNVREKTIKPRFTGTKGAFEEQENPYYEGNLKGDLNKEFVRGYDFLAEQIIPDFLANIYLYEDELAEVGIRLTQRTAEVVGECLSDYIETQRNDLVVSMIEEEDCK